MLNQIRFADFIYVIKTGYSQKIYHVLKHFIALKYKQIQL